MYNPDEFNTEKKNNQHMLAIGIFILILTAASIIGITCGLIYLLNNDYQNKNEGIDELRTIVEDVQKIEKKNSHKMKPKKQSDVDFAPYMRNLQKQIKANWNPPKQEESKSVVVLFTINRDGTLGKSSILKSSGSEDMDNTALETLKNSAPFEPLPENYKGKSVDVQFTFDYNVIYKNEKLERKKV